MLWKKRRLRPLKPASREKVKSVLDSMSSVMNIIAIEFMDTTIIFDGLPRIKGAEHLLYVLDDRINTDKRRRERIRSGKFDEDDLKHRSL